MSIFGLQQDVRTFLCPGCGAVALEGKACARCGLEVAPALAAVAAERRGRFLDAFSDAHNLAITARVLPGVMFLMRSNVARLAGIVGGVVLLVWVPIGLARWWWKYRAPHSDPEWPQVRRWLWEAAGIWMACSIVMVAALWLFSSNG